MLDVCLIGLGLKPKKKEHKLTYSWWKSFKKVISDIICETDIGLVLDTSSSEIGFMEGIKARQVFDGAVEFSNGNPRMIIEEAKADSWFTGELSRIIKEENTLDTQ